MTERLRESLSALMDDEADDLELGRLLRAMDDKDAPVRETWSRYQLASAVMRGIPAAGLSAARSGQRYTDLGAEAATAANALDDEVAAKSAHGDAAGSSAAAVPAPRAAQSGARPWLSFAAAAGVTLALVVGFQWQGSRDGSDRAADSRLATTVDTGPVQADPRALRNDSNGPGAARGEATGALRIPLPQSIRSPRQSAPDARRQVDAYMLLHTEMSALNSANGMVPFARYAAFDGAPRN